MARHHSDPSSSVIFVVPKESHVERILAGGDGRAETRVGLRDRLAAALLPDVRFADARETRLALGVALEETKTKAGQLDLFGGASAGEDPLLATLRGRGGGSWVRTVSAIDDAIGKLRARGVTEMHLDRVRGSSVVQNRARTLAAAMRALDTTLARSGARDARLRGQALARMIRDLGRRHVATVVGATSLRARWLLRWSPNDLAWWRALDDVLGDARIILPAYDKPLESSRELDPFEVIADHIARHLDAAPETEPIAPASPSASRVVRAESTRDQARIVSSMVASAIDAGTPIERIAIAYVERDEQTLTPLRQALAADRVVFHDPLGPPPTSVPIVAAALHALAASESRDRFAVARLLRSTYVDPAGKLAGAARALETHATAAGKDASERLVRTAELATSGEENGKRMRRVVEIFDRARLAKTRRERVASARVLFAELGFNEHDRHQTARTFAHDDVLTGVAEAERLAIARDASAWDALQEALNLQEQAADRDEIDPDVFRLELAALVDKAAKRPSNARVGAVQVTSLEDLVGEEIELLFVLDSNDGVLPRESSPVTLVSEALEGAVSRVVKDGVTDIVAAQDLAALHAIEPKRTVYITTAQEAVDTPSTPSRVVLALERAAVTIESGAAIRASATASSPTHKDERLREALLQRVTRESTRESFFLDPQRPLSDVVGALSTTAAITAVIKAETGGASKRPLAVTSIERFAQCPFKGYAHVILGARAAEQQQELPDAREEGNLGHNALAAAFLATRDRWSARPRDATAIMEEGLRAADIALASAAGHAPLRAIVRLRVRESVRTLLERAIADESWDFILAEQPFGSKARPSATGPQVMEPSWPAFEVAGELWLRGTIDRVDKAHLANEVRVVDYKRSRSTVRSSSASLGVTALQVPIYAVVASRKLDARATGAYIPMQTRDLAAETKPKISPEERVTQLSTGKPSETEIEKRVLELVRSVRSGRVAPTPARESECTYCDVSGGCRKPRFAMAPSDEPEVD